MAVYGMPMRRRTLLLIAKKTPLRIRAGLPHLHAWDLEMAHVGQWFHAASDTTRLAMLEFLSQRARSQHEMVEILGAPQSSVAFHLRVLRDSGLVREQRDGRRKYYSLNGETFDYMIAFTRTVSPGAHRGTCPLDCCRD